MSTESDLRWFERIGKAIDAARAGEPKPQSKPDALGRTVSIDAALVCRWCFRPYASPQPGRPGLFCAECHVTANAHYREHIARAKQEGALIDFPKVDYFEVRLRCLNPVWRDPHGNADLKLLPRARTGGTARTKPEGHRPRLEGRCAICNGRFGWRTTKDGKRMSVDHIWPLADGGPHIASNVRWVHKGCNGKASRRGGLDVPESQAIAIVESLHGHPHVTPQHVRRGEQWLMALRDGWSE